MSALLLVGSSWTVLISHLGIAPHLFAQKLAILIDVNCLPALASFVLRASMISGIAWVVYSFSALVWRPVVLSVSLCLSYGSSFACWSSSFYSRCRWLSVLFKALFLLDVIPFAIDGMSLAIASDLAACISFGIGDFFIVGGDVCMLQLFWWFYLSVNLLWILAPF